MRKAFVVIGAESAGTRMLTKAFISAGCWGDSGHEQRVDNHMKFAHLPHDHIVIRRSIPHAGSMPKVGNVRSKLIRDGYTPTIVAVERDDSIVTRSQLRDEQHAHSPEQAAENIQNAKAIVNEFADYRVEYEKFVTDPSYRQEFFSKLGLPSPKMDFFNGNEKYR